MGFDDNVSKTNNSEQEAVELKKFNNLLKGLTVKLFVDKMFIELDFLKINNF